jgi:hypothetical protein
MLFDAVGAGVDIGKTTESNAVKAGVDRYIAASQSRVLPVPSFGDGIGRWEACRFDRVLAARQDSQANQPQSGDAVYNSDAILPPSDEEPLLVRHVVQE